MSNHVTIADVANHLGVSKSTVSHALSGKRRISTEGPAAGDGGGRRTRLPPELRRAGDEYTPDPAWSEYWSKI